MFHISKRMYFGSILKTSSTCRAINSVSNLDFFPTSLNLDCTHAQSIGVGDRS